MREKKETWESRQVPEWIGVMPRIIIEGSESEGYCGVIMWKNKVLGHSIQYSRHNVVFSECKRIRVKYMKMILKGEI